MLLEVFNGATRTGRITTVQPGAKFTSPLDKVGSFSFSCSAADPDAASLIEGRTVYGYENGKVRLSGKIDKISKSVGGDGVPMLQVSGPAIAQELVQARSGEVAISEPGWATAVGVSAVHIDPGTGAGSGAYLLTESFDENNATPVAGADFVDNDKWLYIGGAVPFTTIQVVAEILAGGYGGGTWANGNPAGASAQYFDGTDWIGFTMVSDTTIVGGNSFAQNGVITFTLSGGPMQQTTEHGVSAYFIRGRFNAAADRIRIGEVQTWGLVPTDTALALVAAVFPTTGNGYAGTWQLGLDPTYPDGLAATVKTDVFDTIARGNVFEALTKLTELTGEHFYCTADRRVVWIGNTHSVAVGPDTGGTGTLDLQVSATAADDGHCYNVGATFVNGTSTLSVGKGGNDSQWLMAWQRFTGVTIPQGATITAAYLQERTPNTDTDNPVLSIQAEDVDNAVAPIDAADRQTKATTTASVGWTLDDSVAGTWYNSPSIVSVIQEIVDRAGWVSGNAIQIFLNNNGSGVNVIRLFSTGATEPTHAGKLHIEYSTVVAGEPLHIYSPPVPSLVEDDTSVALLSKLTIETDGHQRATRVYPHGAGLGDGSLDLTYATMTMPAGYVMVAADNYIRLDPEGTRIDAEPDFKDIGPLTADKRARENAADALAAAALVYLGRHSAANVVYAVECVNLTAGVVRPGNKVWVEYREYVAGQLVASVDDANLIVLSITESFGAGAAVTSALTVSTVAEWPVSDTEYLARMMRNARAMGATPQAVGVGDVRTSDFAVDARPFGTGAGGLARTTSSAASGGGGSGMAVHALTGGYHSEAGLTAGHVLKATSATAFGFAAIADADLPASIARAAITLTAGDGLTGGGDLSANRTLALAATVAGAGLTYAAGVLAVGVSGLGLSVAADAVTLTSSSSPGAAAAILATDANGLTQLVGLGIGIAPIANYVLLDDGKAVGWRSGAADISMVKGRTAGTVSNILDINVNTLATYQSYLNVRVYAPATYLAQLELAANTVTTGPRIQLRYKSDDATQQGVRLFGGGLGLSDAATGVEGTITMPTAGYIGLGAAAGRLVYDSSTTPDTLAVMSARLGIGTLTPAYNIDAIEDGAIAGVQLTSYATTPSNRAIFSARSARGSLATPADVVAGDMLGEVIGGGYSGAATTGAFRATWCVRGFVDTGTVSATSLPTGIVVQTTPDGSVTRAEVARFPAAGGYQVTGGFGCNAKTPQAAYTVGAAATDLATVITLANNLRTALINDGIVKAA